MIGYSCHLNQARLASAEMFKCAAGVNGVKNGSADQ